MALHNFVAGQYSSTYNAISTGPTESGYVLTKNSRSESISRSDAYGDSMLDAVWRGGDVACRYDVLQAQTPGAVAAYWPWSNNQFLLTNAANPIGRLASDLAKIFIMSATANTPAAVLGQASITASKAVVPPDYNYEALYDSRLRKISIRLQFLPYLSGSDVIWASVT